MEMRLPGSNGSRKRAVDLELSLDKLEHLEARINKRHREGPTEETGEEH